MKSMITALGVAILSAPTMAAAENPLARKSSILSLADLDLATVDGQRRLAIRLDRASRDVCGDRVASIHLALDAQARDCRAGVTADIRARIEARTARLDAQRPVQLASVR
jgi:UrcA family protein